MLTQQVELGRVAFEVGTLVHEASVRRGLNRDQPPLVAGDFVHVHVSTSQQFVVEPASRPGRRQISRLCQWSM